MSSFFNPFVSTIPHKKILPVVYITTHGSYELIKWSKGKGIDKIEGEDILKKKLPLGMKIHIISSVPLGVCSFALVNHFNTIYENINRYTHDKRTEETLINDLADAVGKAHNDIIDNNSVEPEHEPLLAKLERARTYGKMTPYQTLDNLNNKDTKKSPIYYEKYFKRTIKEEEIEEDENKILEEDLKTYNESTIGRRINLIRPTDYRFYNQYMGSPITDIYDNVILYQSQRTDLFDPIEVPENTVLLSGIIYYMYSIGIDEFIIMDYSCSYVSGSPSSRTLRSLTRKLPIKYFEPIDSKRGGKRTKKYQRRKTKSKQMNRDRKLSRKTRTNKKRVLLHI